jgi:hypothetical protein
MGACANLIEPCLMRVNEESKSRSLARMLCDTLMVSRPQVLKVLAEFVVLVVFVTGPSCHRCQPFPTSASLRG